MRKWFFLFASIFISFALFSQTISPSLDLLSEANSKFKAHVISIGFDYINTPDSSLTFGSFGKTNFCGLDAQKITNHIKSDTNFLLDASFLFTDSTKNLSSNLIFSSIDSIINSSDTNDVFVFYLAAAADSNSILLPNGEYLFMDDLLSRSNQIVSKKQIYLIDYTGSDKSLENNLIYHIKSNPYESRLNELNRVVLSIDVSFEDPIIGGGLFTHCLIKTNSLIDLFNDHRKRTKYFNEIYLNAEHTDHWLAKDININFFSERDFSQKHFLQKEIISRGEPLSEDNDTIKDLIIEQGETLCLIIGNNLFEGFSNLNNTTNDSKKLKDILDSDYQTTIIYKENITYVDYLETLLKIKKNYEFKPGSQFLTYIASHGFKEGINGTQIILTDSQRKKSGVLVKAQPVIQLQKFINDLSATKTLLILDVCYSGGMYDKDFIKCEKLKLESEGEDFYNASQYSEIIKNTLTDETNLCIASASKNQTASDGVKGSNSPFSYLLIKYLTKYKKNIGDAFQLKVALNKKQLRKLKAISYPIFITYGGNDLNPEYDNFLFIKK